MRAMIPFPRRDWYSWLVRRSLVVRPSLVLHIEAPVWVFRASAVSSACPVEW